MLHGIFEHGRTGPMPLSSSMLGEVVRDAFARTAARTFSKAERIGSEAAKARLAGSMGSGQSSRLCTVDR